MTIHLGSQALYSRILRARPLSAWVTGWKQGWDQPTDTARMGHDFGQNLLLVLAVVAVIALLARMARRRDGAGS